MNIIYHYIWGTTVKSDIAIVRYNSDGSLDTTFGDDGKVFTDVNKGEDYGNDLSIQADGKIVVVGYSSSIFSDKAVIVRYLSGGKLRSGTDVNGNGTVGLEDVILTLKILADIPFSDSVNIEADINNNGKIDLAEAIYVLQHLAGLFEF